MRGATPLGSRRCRTSVRKTVRRRLTGDGADGEFGQGCYGLDAGGLRLKPRLGLREASPENIRAVERWGAREACSVCSLVAARTAAARAGRFIGARADDAQTGFAWFPAAALAAGLGLPRDPLLA